MALSVSRSTFHKEDQIYDICLDMFTFRDNGVNTFFSSSRGGKKRYLDLTLVLFHF